MRSPNTCYLPLFEIIIRSTRTLICFHIVGNSFTIGTTTTTPDYCTLTSYKYHSLICDSYCNPFLILNTSQLSDEKQHSNSFIAAATAIYIGLGFLVFIFLPAGLFTFLEERWNYLDAVYYSYITLTTIGFGDLVSGGFV